MQKFVKLRAVGCELLLDEGVRRRVEFVEVSVKHGGAKRMSVMCGIGEVFSRMSKERFYTLDDCRG